MRDMRFTIVVLAKVILNVKYKLAYTSEHKIYTKFTQFSN